MSQQMFYKHRDELETFAIDFTLRLGALETLTAINALRIHREADDLDVSAQFGNPSGAIDGTSTKVEFSLQDAQSATDQIKGQYRIFCEVETSEAEKIIETPLLYVNDPASIT